MAKEKDQNMPELLDNQIWIFGEKRTLKPLMGRRGRSVVWKMVDVAGAIIAAAQSVGLDIVGLISGDVHIEDISQVVQTLAAMLMALARFLTSAQWDKFELEVLPILLGEPPDSTRLEEEGDPVEVYYAAARAIVYHIKVSFQKPQLKALGKLFAEAERKNAPEEPTEEAAPQKTTD